MGDPRIDRQRGGIDGKTVVLGGDEYPPRGQILDRVIRTMVPGLHFDRACSQRKAHDLLAKATPGKLRVDEDGLIRMEDQAAQLEQAVAVFTLPNHAGANTVKLATTVKPQRLGHSSAVRQSEAHSLTSAAVNNSDWETF